ncbi:hypothetical protein FQA39_LY19142 [Lamprigera yunnana]|nr:hypothetical protein FQA39_LY19142 [Lamprigera yunnana]
MKDFVLGYEVATAPEGTRDANLSSEAVELPSSDKEDGQLNALKAQKLDAFKTDNSEAINFDEVFKKLTVKIMNNVGKFGRALKEDKIIKVLNQSGIMKEIGLEHKIKNFYQISKEIQMKDFILKDKTKISLGKTVNDAQVLQTIFSVSNATMKKELKRLPYEELQMLVEIEKNYL